MNICNVILNNESLKTSLRISKPSEKINEAKFCSEKNVNAILH